MKPDDSKLYIAEQNNALVLEYNISPVPALTLPSEVQNQPPEDYGNSYTFFTLDSGTTVFLLT